MNSTLDQLAHLVESQPAAGHEVLLISPDAIIPDENQPRTSPGDVQELAESIRALGVQQPLLVRPHHDQEATYILVAGERRYRAALEAGTTQLPCIVLNDEIDDPARRLIVQITENIQRSDLDMMEVAHAIARLVNDHRLAKQDVARLLGKSPAYVSKHLALLQATGPAQEAIQEGLLQSPETYRLLNKLPEKRLQRLVETARRNDQPISRSDVERLATAGKDVTETEDPSASGRVPATYSLRLTADQIARLIEAIGGDVPREPRELKPALLQILQTSSWPSD